MWEDTIWRRNPFWENVIGRGSSVATVTSWESSNQHQGWCDIDTENRQERWCCNGDPLYLTESQVELKRRQKRLSVYWTEKSVQHVKKWHSYLDMLLTVTVTGFPTAVPRTILCNRTSIGGQSTIPYTNIQVSVTIASLTLLLPKQFTEPLNVVTNWLNLISVTTECFTVTVCLLGVNTTPFSSSSFSIWTFDKRWM